MQSPASADSLMLVYPLWNRGEDTRRLRGPIPFPENPIVKWSRFPKWARIQFRISVAHVLFVMVMCG
jgi:hypothetical protein